MRLAEDDTPLDIDFSSPAPVWTDELVMERMIEAFEILPFISGTVGPARFKTTWPAVCQELSSLLDALFGEQPRDPKPPQIQPIPPTAAEIERAEEALCWPARFLADMPKAADALNVWAACKAYGHSIRKAMEDRTRRATERARLMELKQKAKRRGIAAVVAAWANAEIAKAAGDEARICAIKLEAAARIRNALEKADLLVVRMITPEEAMSDVVLTKDSLDWQRKVAARVIADSIDQPATTSR